MSGFQDVLNKVPPIKTHIACLPERTDDSHAEYHLDIIVMRGVINVSYKESVLWVSTEHQIIDIFFQSAQNLGWKRSTKFG